MNLQAYIALGWSPIFANATTNGSVIQEVVGWVGGNGTAPVTGVYVGSNGFVTNITDGVDIRGAAGGGGGAAISAGGNSQSTGTVNFSNSNGVTFGLSNNGVMTASVFTNYQSTGNYLTTAAQSNQVVNSLNGSTGQISLNVGSSLSSSTNGSSVTFGLASNITTALQSAGAYLTTAMLSNAITLSNINISGGTTSSNLSNFKLIDSNGVSWSVDTGSKIYATVKTDYQSSNANYLTSQSNQAASASNGSFTFQTLGFSNGNGVTFGTSAGSIITASVAAAGGAQTAISGISAGTTQATSGTVSFADSNGITWGMNGNTLTATVATNYQSQGAYLTTADLSQNSSKYIQNWKLSGNTSGTTSSAQGTDLWLAGGNGVTLSGSSNTISFSVATNYQSQGAYLTTADLSANSSKYVQNWKLTGNTSGTTSSAQGTDMWFSGGNGVTISGNSNSLVFSVATNYQSQGAYLTTADLSANSSKYMQNWKITGNTSGTTSSAQGTDLWLAGGNGLTISGSSNSLSFSVNTSYRASNDAIGTNTAQSNVTWTVNSSGISLDGRGYAGTGTTFNGANISGSITQNSLGLNLSLSVAAPGGGGAVNFSAGTTSNNLQSVIFSNSNGVSFGLGTGASSNMITASAAGGAGGVNIAVSNTTFTSGTVVFSNNGGALTLGSGVQSVLVSVPQTSSLAGTGLVSISVNGSTISIGAAEVVKSYFANIEVINGLTALSEGGSSNFVMPINIPYDLSIGFVRIPMSLSLGSGTFATTANTTIGISQSVTYFVNIYSMGTGANSRSLQYITGGSLTNGFNVTGQIGAASNNQTVGQTLTYAQAGGLGTASFTRTYNVNAASINFSTTGLTSFNGVRWFDMPLATSLSGGAYWVGIQRSTTQSTSGTAGMSTLGLTKFNLYVTQVNSNIAAWGVSSNASTDAYYMGLGLWSTNTLGATSSSMALSGISTSASQPFLPLQLIRQA